MCFSRKLQTLRPENSSKRDSNTDIFLLNCQDFQELVFYRAPQVAGFKISNSNVLFKDFSRIPLTSNLLQVATLTATYYI